MIDENLAIFSNFEPDAQTKLAHAYYVFPLWRASRLPGVFILVPRASVCLSHVVGEMDDILRQVHVT